MLAGIYTLTAAVRNGQCALLRDITLPWNGEYTNPGCSHHLTSALWTRSSLRQEMREKGRIHEDPRSTVETHPSRTRDTVPSARAVIRHLSKGPRRSSEA